MPIFEYSCPECGCEFEEIVLDQKEEVSCPKCGSAESRKLISCCRTKMAGSSSEVSQDLGSLSSASGGCAGCSGGSCATCG